MSELRMADSAFPPSPALLDQVASEGVTAWGWYMGASGATPHVWSRTEVTSLAPRVALALPIWVPFSTDGEQQAAVATHNAPSEGVPRGCSILLDVEAGQSSAWTVEELSAWAAGLRPDYVPVVYGDFATVASARLAGIPAILANWVTSPSWPAKLPGGVSGWQWESLPSVDLDLVDGQAANARRWSIGMPIPLMATNPAAGPVLVPNDSPCVDMALCPSGGYWVLNSSGHVAAFGCPWWGSPAVDHPGQSSAWSAIVAEPSGAGYAVLSMSGNIDPQGQSARWYGSPAAAGSMDGSTPAKKPDRVVIPRPQ